VEADESDGTLIKYHPYMSIILNVSKDHKNEADILDLFDKLTKQSDYSLVNADDKRLHSLKSSFSFGLTNKADCIRILTN
jgi:UDP-N-acetylmuramate--alanine ligase